MATSKTQDELRKQYDSVPVSLDDPEVQKMIRQADEMMGKPARMLLAQAGLDSSTSSPFQLVDLACGAVLVAACLQESVQPEVLAQSKILCADISERFVNILDQRVERDRWVNVESAVFDAQNSGLAGASFSHVTVSFGLHIIPDPAAVVRDAVRILRPGGTLAFSVPHADTGINGGWVPDLRSGMEALPFKTSFPNPMPVALHGKMQWVDPAGVEKELKEHGFENIQIETIEVVNEVRDAESFVADISGMIKWMINTYWTEEQRDNHAAGFNDFLIEHLKEKHGGKGWKLTSRVIVATAQKPGIN